MDSTSGQNIPQAPEPERKRIFQVSSKKDELHSYISKPAAQGTQPLQTRKIVTGQTVDVSFLNSLAVQGETETLKVYLRIAKQSMLFLGLIQILKNAPPEAAQLVIEKLEKVPPKAPFEMLKSYASECDTCLAIIELFIKKGWNPASKNENGENLLQLAEKLGNPPESALHQGLVKLGVK